MEKFLIVLGAILLIIGVVYLEAFFVVWVVGLFGVYLTTLQGLAIVLALSFVGGFFKSTSKK